MRHALVMFFAATVACSAAKDRDAGDPPLASDDAALQNDAGVDAYDAPPPQLDAVGLGDTGVGDTNITIDPDAACASTSVKATLETLPVDIVWMVDNSASMKPAVDQVNQGLNDFAAAIGAKTLDYKVIVLSLRGTGTVTSGGSTLYPICIPPPLAGDSSCGNGARFFQSAVNVKSTQPLEQILGTLGQTTGYTPGTDRGGEPWLAQLRTNATKTFVIVTDDESRLAASDFEHFPGGTNPNNSSLQLPPGILEPKWSGAFDGYTFDAIYGYGSETDPGVRCTYPDGSQPPSSGNTYTTLVNETHGVRAKICDGASAWGPFFDAVATAVSKSTKIDCSIAIPAPASGTLDPGEVNVQIGDGTTSAIVPKTSGAASCGPSPAWYYDDAANPTHVILCPSACASANASAGGGKAGEVDVLFGCKTIIQ